MNFHVLTLFPEMIEQGVCTSITGRAIKKNTIGLHTVNIRDFATDKRRRVDDYTYGGGAGMLMQAQPVYDAWRSVRDEIPDDRKVRTIYVTPQGHTFTQHMAEEFAMADELIFLCGHYEGIDERVLEEVVTDYVSIGDYVLTGGELASMVMIDAISRMVPGVLHNDVSADTESFHGNLLEYPQYTRPEQWHGKSVPEELLTGDPKMAAAWRLEHSIARTKARRPDLYEKYCQASACRSRLLSEKITNMDMISQIDQGHYRILLAEEQTRGILLKNPLSGSCYYSDFEKNAFPSAEETAGRAAAILKKENWNKLYLRGDACSSLMELLAEELAAEESGKSFSVEELTLYVLTRREKLPVTGLYRPDGKPTAKNLVIRREQDAICLIEGVEAGRAVFDLDGCVESIIVSGQAEESLRELTVKALLTYALNELLGQGKTPYLYLDASQRNLASLAEEVGMYAAKIPIRRLKRN